MPDLMHMLNGISFNSIVAYFATHMYRSDSTNNLDDAYIESK